jgi:hypothetical protein
MSPVSSISPASFRLWPKRQTRLDKFYSRRAPHCDGLRLSPPPPAAWRFCWAVPRSGRLRQQQGEYWCHRRASGNPAMPGRAVIPMSRSSFPKTKAGRGDCNRLRLREPMPRSQAGRSGEKRQPAPTNTNSISTNQRLETEKCRRKRNSEPSCCWR